MTPHVSKMNRTLRVIAVGLVMAATLLGTPLTGANAPVDRAEAATSQPNILVIVTDDQRADTMWALPRTRKIFGRGGTRFPYAFDTTPVCCPSRSSIFTGQYAHNHGVKRNDAGDNFPADRSIQRYLQEAGYRTAIVGKYLGWNLNDPPYWDRWTVLRPPGYYDVRFNVDGAQRTIAQYTTTFLEQQAKKYLAETEKQDDQPWFLYVAPNAPHPPSTALPRYRHAWVRPFKRTPGFREKDRSDKPPYVQEKHVGEQRVSRFYRRQMRALMPVDDLVSGVFQTLSEQGERRSTLAIYISDNGYMWGEHGLLNKRFPYTESIKAPLYARWPGHIAEGVTDERIVANIDLMPTILEAAGLEADFEPDGRSFLGFDARDRILNEYFADIDRIEIPTWASTRTYAYQYIEYYDHEGNLKFQEYYDLEEDPHQLQNTLTPWLGVAAPGTEELHEQLQADRECAGSGCP